MSDRSIMCPRCRTGLRIQKQPDGIFWSCPQCTGLALNLAVLRRCLPQDRVQEFWRCLQTGSRTSAPCPSCSQSLMSFTLDRVPQTLTLDVCKTCQIVWFDKGEFDALPVQSTPTDEFSPETRQKLALLKIQYQRDLDHQMEEEADKVDYWAHVAIAIVRLLIRVALRV